MAEADLPAHEADDNQVPFESAESAQEVEIVDDGTTTTATDEHEEYSEKVQRRINQLTKRIKDTERERDEATRYAQAVQQESTQIKGRLQTLDEGYLSEYGGRISAEQKQAQDELKRATDVGDTESMVAAQQKMSQLAVAADRYHQAKASQEKQAAAAPQAAPQPATPDQRDIRRLHHRPFPTRPRPLHQRPLILKRKRGPNVIHGLAQIMKRSVHSLLLGYISVWLKPKDLTHNQMVTMMS